MLRGCHGAPFIPALAPLASRPITYADETVLRISFSPSLFFQPHCRQILLAPHFFSPSELDSRPSPFGTRKEPSLNPMGPPSRTYRTSPGARDTVLASEPAANFLKLSNARLQRAFLALHLPQTRIYAFP